jgi:HEAT repeat protein
MNGILEGADLGLAATLVALLAAIVGTRLLRRRRRRRRAKLRAQLEDVIVRYMIDEDAKAPSLAHASRPARETALDVALEALLELRGRERERLTALLEQTGIVTATIGDLGSWRVARRRRAADALGLVRTYAAREPLLDALRDRDKSVRLCAAQALAELADDDLVPRLTTVAEEAAAKQPGAVAELLLALGASARPALGELYARTRSVALRRMVASVVGELRLPEYGELLRSALEEEDELAARAARGLGLIGDVDAVDGLLRLVADASRAWFVRAAATAALGRIGDPRAVDHLRRELYARDSGWELRAAAARALAELGGPGRAVLDRAARRESGEAGVQARAALA